ncbi:DUF418 domain-containing protein [Muriicola sp.]|uniref:DUF418 domain-containing protein n=1 Tax=Muriicola sp. TaxID=2020856 RepID=UPI003C76C352
MSLAPKEQAGTSRMDIVDALRGFSLAGIVIVHMVENYIGAPFPEGTMEATHQGPLDYVVDGFILLFLRGKFFALFSFLFGLSFFIQMDKARRGGMDFRMRFLWRLMILLAIGFAHSLLYRGDILTIYALLGALLIPCYRLKDRWLLLIASLLFLGVGRYLIFTISNGDSFFSEGDYSPESPLIKSYFEVISNGTLWDVFRSNAVEGHMMKIDFQMGIFSRGYLTFGFFLLGLYAGRSNFFRSYMDQRKMTRNILYFSIALFLISTLITIGAFAQLGPNPTFDNWLAMIGLTGYDLTNVAMTFILLCLFVMAYRAAKWRRFLNAFSSYGRTALTNYVLQSIIGTFIFYGWGLHYLGVLSNTITFTMALLIVFIQLFISKWWMRQFYYGPFEWLWRSLTHLTLYPLRKRSS